MDILPGALKADSVEVFRLGSASSGSGTCRASVVGSGCAAAGTGKSGEETGRTTCKDSGGTMGQDEDGEAMGGGEFSPTSTGPAEVFASTSPWIKARICKITSSKVCPASNATLAIGLLAEGVSSCSAKTLAGMLA